MELYRIAGRPVYLPHLVIGLALTALLTVLNYRGIRLSATFQNWTSFGTLALFVIFVALGVSRGSPANFQPLFTHTPWISILLVIQIVPYFMTGFESVGKAAEEASPDFRSHGFFRAIWMAIVIGILFYASIVAAVAFVAPWRQLTGEKFMTAVAFQQAMGSRPSHQVGSSTSSSPPPCSRSSNASTEISSPPAACSSPSDAAAWSTPRVGTIHPRFQTPSAAVLCVGLATAACMLLGDAILVPVTEVGSVACAIGWSATCAACLALSRAKPDAMKLSTTERAVAWFGLTVGIAMALMKLVPAIPGHFTIYEWLALAVWIALGVAAISMPKSGPSRSPQA